MIIANATTDQQIVRQASAARREGRSQTAEALLREGLAARPGNARILLALCDLAREQRDLPKAKALAVQAVASASDPQTQFSANIKLISTSLKVGDIGGAEAAAVRALELQPSNGRALRMLSEVALTRGDIEKALSWAEQAVTQEPNNVANHGQLGMALQRAGRLAEAIGALEGALKLDPTSVLLHTRMADLLLRRGDLAGTVRHAQAAWQQEPGDPRSTLAMARAQIAHADLATAEQTVTFGLTAHPAHIGLLCQLSDVRRRSGNLHGAFEAASRATALEARNPSGPLQLAQIEAQQGALASAARIVQDFLAVEPRSVPALRRLAEIKQLQDDRDAAVALADRAASLEPKEPRNLDLLARLHLAAGNPDAAMIAAREAIALPPPDAGRLLRISEILLRKGKVDESRQWQMRALDLAITQAPIDFRPLLRKSRFMLSLGDIEEARRLAEQALHLAPGSGQPSSVLADIAHAAGERALAADWLQRAISAEPHDAALHGRLARTLAADNRFDEAEACLSEAAALAPNTSHYVRRRGELRLRLNDLTGALVFCKTALALDPLDPENHDLMTRIYLAQGTLAEAEVSAHQAAELQPLHPTRFRRVAEVAMRKGDLEDASVWRLRALDLAIELAPTDPRAMLRKAEFLLGQEYLDEAEELALRASDLELVPGDSARILATIAIRRGDRADALHWLTRLPSPDPKDATNYSRLGALMAEAGDVDSAAAAVKKAIELRPDVTRFAAQLRQLQS